MAERRALLRANQRATVMGAFELLRAWYAPSRTLAGMARIEGLPHLQAALDAGQGVLLFAGHFTCTELAGASCPRRSADRWAAWSATTTRFAWNVALEQRATRVFKPVLEKKDVRGLLRALQGGALLVYSADQNFTYQNAFVPFFNIQAATLTSTPELVRRGNACMLPFWFHREADGAYCLRIEAAWPGWIDGSAEQAATIYMRELESVVRRHPEQYLWVHKRFKTRPPGEPGNLLIGRGLAVGLCLEALVHPKILRRHAPDLHFEQGHDPRRIGERRPCSGNPPALRRFPRDSGHRPAAHGTAAGPAAPLSRAIWWVEVRLHAGWPKKGTNTLSPRRRFLVRGEPQDAAGLEVAYRRPQFVAGEHAPWHAPGGRA